VDLLNSFQVEKLKLIFNLRGREWRKPQNSLFQYIQGWRIGKLQAETLLLQQMPCHVAAVCTSN
jgi:hypothetical protein